MEGRISTGHYPRSTTHYPLSSDAPTGRCCRTKFPRRFSWMPRAARADYSGCVENSARRDRYESTRRPNVPMGDMLHSVAGDRALRVDCRRCAGAGDRVERQSDHVDAAQLRRDLRRHPRRDRQAGCLPGRRTVAHAAISNSPRGWNHGRSVGDHSRHSTRPDCGELLLHAAVQQSAAGRRPARCRVEADAGGHQQDVRCRSSASAPLRESGCDRRQGIRSDRRSSGVCECARPAGDREDQARTRPVVPRGADARPTRRTGRGRARDRARATALAECGHAVGSGVAVGRLGADLSAECRQPPQAADAADPVRFGDRVRSIALADRRPVGTIRRTAQRRPVAPADVSRLARLDADGSAPGDSGSSADSCADSDGQSAGPANGRTIGHPVSVESDAVGEHAAAHRDAAVLGSATNQFLQPTVDRAGHRAH